MCEIFFLYCSDFRKPILCFFLQQKISDYKVMAEMIALIVEPTFKPITFSKKPIADDPAPVQPTTLPHAVPSTTIAPTPGF